MRRMARPLESHADPISDVRAYKARLLNHALHALATPLTPALLRVRALRGSATPAQQRCIGRLEAELDEMRHILEDLATVAQMDAGSLPLARVRLDVGRLLAEVCAAPPVVERAKLTTPVRSAWHRGDPDRLRQAFRLLIDRALAATRGLLPVVLQHRPEGAWLRIGAAATPTSAADAGHVPLWSIDGAPARRLDLYIADAVVACHGGTAWVQSADPLTFGLHLPREACL